MAQVTVDYEEFAALKNQEKVFEEKEADYMKTVADLKKEIHDLKDTRKVIIRERKIKRDENGRIPLNKYDWEYYNVDTYINFDDIEDDVRKHYQKEINAEIEHHRIAAEDYESKKQSLKAEIEKSVKADVDAANDKAKQTEQKYYQLRNYLHPIINRLLTISTQLENKMFPPNKEIAAINEVINDIKDKVDEKINKEVHKPEEEIEEEEFVNCPWMEDVPYRR